MLPFSRDLFGLQEKLLLWVGRRYNKTPFAFQLHCQLDMAIYMGSASQSWSPIFTEFSGEGGYLLVFLSLFHSLVIVWL